MNWTPGRIVGTVKPAGATVDPIAAGMPVPCPVPAPVLVPVPVQTITAPKLVPAGTVVPAVAVPTPPTGGSSLLKGSVQSLVGGDKILGTVNIAGSSKPGLSSEELTQKAISEIHRDVQRGRVRAAQVGALGWRECPLKKTNKRFLSRTVNSVLQHNKRETLRNFYSSTRKLIEMDRRGDESMGQEGRHHHRSHHHRHRRRSHSGERERKKSEEKGKVEKIDLDDELEDGEVRDDDD